MNGSINWNHLIKLQNYPVFSDIDDWNLGLYMFYA